jgi:hypothetical protein
MSRFFDFLVRRVRILSLLAVTAFVLFGFAAHLRAQDTLPPAPVLQNPSSGENLARFFSSKTPYEFWLTCLIGALGLAIIAALIFGVRRTRNTRPEDIARPVIVLTVILGTLILVTAGYSNEQIAPAFGLFGTIIGYMLGRLSQPTQTPNGPADPLDEDDRRVR